MLVIVWAWHEFYVARGEALLQFLIGLPQSIEHLERRRAKAARLDYRNIAEVTALASLGAGVSATGLLGFAAAAVFAVVIPRLRHRRNY